MVQGKPASSIRDVFEYGFAAALRGSGLEASVALLVVYRSNLPQKNHTLALLE
jgi:hypothetical protein